MKTLKKINKNKKRQKTKRKRQNQVSISRRKKIFKDYGDGIIYMIFDGSKHVFKYVGN